MNNRIDEYVEIINNSLEDYHKKCLEESKPYCEEIVEAMFYSLNAGGKRIRPVLVMEFARMCGGEEALKKSITAATAIEMIHTFSLIQDDLPCMDDDDYRRGRLACHKAYREDVALLAGDALLNLAFDIVADDKAIDSDTKLRLINEVSKATGVQGMIGGQYIDCYNNGEHAFSEEKLVAMYGMKTSALLSAACCMGCICAGAYDKIEYAKKYAYDLGIAFQIIDDILDVTSSTEELGKKVGSDMERGKHTFVEIYGIEKSEEYAEQLTTSAISALDVFDDNDFIKELTSKLLKRKK